MMRIVLYALMGLAAGAYVWGFNAYDNPGWSTRRLAAWSSISAVLWPLLVLIFLIQMLLLLGKRTARGF